MAKSAAEIQAEIDRLNGNIRFAQREIEKTRQDLEDAEGWVEYYEEELSKALDSGAPQEEIDRIMRAINVHETAAESCRRTIDHDESIYVDRPATQILQLQQELQAAQEKEQAEAEAAKQAEADKAQSEKSDSPQSADDIANNALASARAAVNGTTNDSHQSADAIVNNALASAATAANGEGKEGGPPGAGKKEVSEEDAKLQAEAKKREEERVSEAHANTGVIVDDGKDVVDPVGSGIIGKQWVGSSRDTMVPPSATDAIVNNALAAAADAIGVKEQPKPSKRNNTVFEDEEDGYNLRFGIPNWGVENYLQERDSWQKQLDSITGEPGWFYFKIFFKFNTAFGLLGDIVTKPGDNSYQNSAIMYLSTLYSKAYSQELVETRRVYLERFVKTLSFISTKAPWFFKGIKGLDKCGNAYINDFSKEKSIEIECSEEAIDMRLSTLLDMYKFVAFDEINCKEILPDNLRKFDMVVVLFHVPLRYWHTKSKINGIVQQAKSFNGADANGNHLLTYKMFSFLNCEIDPASLGIMVPNSVTNEQPFQLGKNSIKINYDRCFNHLVNEWTGDAFGPDGAKFAGNMGTTRKNQIRNAYTKFSSNGGNKNTLVDVTESLISSMFDGSEFVVGNVRSEFQKDDVSNLYLGPKRDHSDINFVPKKEESEYFRRKLKESRGRATPGNNIGNLYNYEVGPGTVYFENKIKNLKGHGHSMSLYHYMIGPNSPVLGRKESAYFRNKMRFLHFGGNVQNPGSNRDKILPDIHGYLSPYQERYNQWLFDFKYSNTLKNTATYNPYGWNGPTNKMTTTVPKSYLGKTTRNFLQNMFQNIKPSFLR